MSIPTSEQREALAAVQQLRPGEIACGDAYAGTGKTTTCVQIATAMAHWRILYVCFNREMADEARTRFPATVTCSTAHALAYGALGRLFKDRLVGTVRPADLVGKFGMDLRRCAEVIATLNNFYSSEDAALGRQHVAAPETQKAAILESALRCWTDMFRAESVLPITHDAYLKQWVESKPNMRYDFVIVDEGQDLNPVLLRWVRQLVEDGKRVLFVGDTHQSIYGFRKAVNAMAFASEHAASRFRLTESWRFGEQPAAAASLLLSKMKHDNVSLTGRGPKTGVQADAVIGRSNGAVLAAAVEAAKRQKIHFAATKLQARWNPEEAYNFRPMRDVAALARHQPELVRSPQIKPFRTLPELQAYAKETEDRDVLGALNFYERYGSSTDDVLHLLCRQACGPQDTSVHFSTAHRSKGKEWRKVTLLDDFLPLDRPEKIETMRMDYSLTAFDEEVNMLYVALTRCCQSFVPPETCSRFFSSTLNKTRTLAATARPVPALSLAPSRVAAR